MRFRKYFHIRRSDGWLPRIEAYLIATFFVHTGELGSVAGIHCNDHELAQEKMTQPAKYEFATPEPTGSGTFLSLEAFLTLGQIRRLIADV